MKAKKSIFKLTALTSAMLLSAQASALSINQEGNTIVFDSMETSNYTLTVKSPNGETQNFKIENGEFLLTAKMLGVKSLNNGQYKYELTPLFKADSVTQEIRNFGDKGLANEYSKAFQGQAQTHSGVFTLNDDKLIRDNLEIALNKASNVNDSDGNTRDQVILDDLIVDGSACIGFDCVNGESFGFDTLRLKENNLRIKFQDTSASASFPSNDWQITANDSSNGGQNKFSIDDIDGGRTPFTIEASAPSHSLYVDDGGKVGVGTSTPVVNMHVVTGNTPTLRLEQNGSNGFTPQTWDVAGNEANFFIRDATNGSTLPFRIRPGAPNSAIDIAASGNVGIGDTSPDASLNIERSNGTAKILIEETNGTAAARELLKLSNNGGSYITMNNTDTTQSWYITHENSAGTALNISHDAGLALTKTAMRLTTDGNMTISGTLVTAGGTCGGGCDLVFAEGYKLPTIEEHAKEMWANNYLPAVGPTIENAPFNISDKTGKMLNELEKAHIYIAQLNEKLNEKTSELEEIESRLLKLEIQ